MVGLVIASHGQLADALVSTARLIVGELAGVSTCRVEPGASSEDIQQHIRQAIRSVDEGDGVIVFADIVGGSPCTQSLTLCRKQKLEVVTGVNLPMLLKAASLRTAGLPLEELAHQLVQYGQRNITCATDVLRR
jgi:PTS system mannose-specific IIA component